MNALSKMRIAASRCVLARLRNDAPAWAQAYTSLMDAALEIVVSGGGVECSLQLLGMPQLADSRDAGAVAQTIRAMRAQGLLNSAAEQEQRVQNSREQNALTVVR